MAKGKKVPINYNMLRARRQFLGMQQKDAAAAIGVHPRSLHRWEYGWGNPSLSNLVKCAQVYECDVKMFLTEPAKVMWDHLHGLLMETVLFQIQEMEEGGVPNMDMEQVVRLAERLGMLADVDVSVEEETEAQRQMSSEIR